MSPAAVDHGGNSTNNSRRNSLGYSPRDKFSDPKSPKSPDCASSLLQKNLLRFPQTFSPLISFRTTTICGGVVVDNNNLNLHHTPPKRTRPSSLYSPPPTTNTTTPKFFKPEFVRNFNSSEWFGCNDQNSRDSGFESAASTSSSSHRSTPVDQTDTDVITNGGVESSSAAILSSVKRQCRWDDCPNPDLDEGDELLEHILSAHVQPLESSTESCRSSSKNNTNLEKYSCRWKDCKVYCKPSRLYAWLERHVVEKHAGPRPYGCPVPGCRQRFNGRSAAERHINSHFENSVDDETTAAAATATSVPVMTVNARTTTTTTRRNNNKNLHETKRKTSPIKTTDDKIYDVQKCCLLSSRKSFNTTTTTTTTSTVNGGKKKNCINIIPISSSSARLSNDDVVGEPENAACATKILASTVTSSTTTVNKKRCHASSKSSKLYCSMFLMFFVICRKTLFSLSFYVYFFFVSSAALFFFILQ